MNIENNIILIKGEDKTTNVTYCKYENGRYQVTFTDGRTFPYNYNNVQWFRNPVEIDLTSKCVYIDQVPMNNIKKILQFDNYIRLIFNSGSHNLYHSSMLRIEESCLENAKSNNCFQYLKELSQSIGLSVDGNKTLLGKQYDKISYINPKSVLAYYLNPSEKLKANSKGNYIYPFGFNLSQKEATEKALTNALSIIEGPPGTGKTQTILNIISNAVANNKTVAIVSNNNSATENVYEKLKKYNLDFFVATLGKRDNKEKFIEEQKDYYPAMGGWNLEAEESRAIKEQLEKSQLTLDRMLEKNNDLALLKQQRSELIVEQKHFEKEYIKENGLNIKFKTLYKPKAEKIMRFIIELNLQSASSKKASFNRKLRNLLVYGLYTFSFYKHPLEAVVDYLYELYYSLKIEEFDRKIYSLEKELENYSFEDEMKVYSEKSMQLFKDKLYKKYPNKDRRRTFSEEDLWKNFNDVLGEYPVILSTTHSLRNCIKENYLFDYVIVDEASQVDILTGALVMSCAKNLVVVGDLKQLPNIVGKDDINICQALWSNYSLEDAYEFSTYSLLSSITKINGDIPRTLLKEHYRCHPKIIGFCNKKFYDNELIILTKEEDEDKPLALYKTAKGNHARGNVNQRQIDVIKEEILPKIKSGGTTGIISPYRNQVKHLLEVVDSSIEVDTIHKFQGREKDNIILTTVSNEINDFIDEDNIINVAISRAVDNFILVIADNEEEGKDTNLGDLIKYIEYNNCDIVSSKISSVFDLLYKDYEEELLKVLKKTKRISEFDSENLMYGLITDVLSEERFNMLDVIIHKPLRMILKDTSALTEEERSYALHPWTHVDFLIYNKVTKEPVLVVEVDGYKFHVTNEEQLKRDRLKDKILEKYNVPSIRFVTNGSSERGKLVGGLVGKIFVYEK